MPSVRPARLCSSRKSPSGSGSRCLFANFAEAVAEGRGKAQAKALRQTRTRTSANKIADGGKIEIVDADSLRKGDLVFVRTSEIIPADGEVILGAATVDESAITGESAPVIREAGGDRSAVTGGTRVLSDEIKIRITANPGEGFLDRMISLVEGASRQKTPNEIALTILLAALTVVFLLAVVTLKPFGIYSGVNFSDAVLIALLVCLIPTTIGGFLSAIGIAGMDRLLQRNVLAMSGRAVEAAGDVDVLLLDKTGTITLGNRQATAFLPAPGVTEQELADAAQLASLADETPEGRSIVVLAKNFGIRARTIHELPGAQFIPFTAQTRMSGVDFEGKQIRKGSANADPAIHRRNVAGGSRENRGRHFAFRRHAARRRHPRTRARRDSFEGHRERRPRRPVQTLSRDGHPHRDDYRRQQADRRRHRAGGGRGRFSRRGETGGQARAYPPGTDRAAGMWR